MYRYNGRQKKVFLAYKNGATGTTLEAEYGMVYDIVPVQEDMPVPPYGHANEFTLVADMPHEEPAPDPEPAPEPAPETETEHESDGE
jgi:hypothetical protein